MTGLLQTAPVDSIYLEAGVDPIKVEAKRRALITYERWERSKATDPKRQLCDNVLGTRLKNNKGLRKQAKEECLRLVGGRRSLHGEEGNREEV